MSAEDSDFDGLFNEPPPDNDTQRATLARELGVAEGFALIFALCNSADERARQIAALQEELPALNIQEVPAYREIPHLLDVLRATLEDPVPDAVFVYGMENWIRGDANPRSIPFILNLNAARNHFITECPCPLVLWMPEYLLGLIIGGAPDFASVRSGLYIFTSPTAEAQSAMQTIQSLDLSATGDLPLEEKQQRLKELTELLAQVRNLPEDSRNVQDEVYLLDQLANLYQTMARYVEAEPLFREALALEEILRGREHPKTAASLNNLAALYAEQERYEEAEPLYKETLAIKEKTLGRRHLETAITLHNLAQLYVQQGNYDEAEPLYNEALAIYENARGRDHLDTMDILHDLADLYVEQGRYAEAESLYKEVLKVYDKTSGQERREEAVTLHNLAHLYVEQGRYAEADPLFEKALAIFERLSGREHPDTQLIRGNLEGLRRQSEA